MKKVIELLEEAEEKLTKPCCNTFPQATDILIAACRVHEALAELKTPSRRNGEEDRRVRCNWCMSVFDEEHIKAVDDEEYCPICGETGYLMDMPEEESKPRRETPEQYKKRTGEAWPDDWATYVRLIFAKHGWDPYRYVTAKSLQWMNPGTIIVIATEYGPPPDGWKPEEEE
jgi:hypothetical protein